MTGRRLAGRNIALIFEKTSTRTRSAFEVAAHDEGGHVTYLGPGESQLGHKESVKDTASVGVFTNRFLLGGIAAALAFAAALVYLPALQSFFGTAALTPAQLATVAPFPFIVWGADETHRLLIRRHRARHGVARQAYRRGAPGPAGLRRRL